MSFNHSIKAYYTYLKRRFYRVKNKKCSISRANMSFFGGDAESRTPVHISPYKDHYSLVEVINFMVYQSQRTLHH